MQQYFANIINNKIVLKDEDLYHLVTVLRAKEKRKIICIIDSKRYFCEFSGNNNSYNVKILYEIIDNPELKVDIELYQALIRNENFDLVLQKSTELGVKTVIPTIFNRNVVKIEKAKEEAKLNRYQTILKNSAEQSHRLIIPLIQKPIRIEDINLEDDEVGIVAYENEKNISLQNIENDILNSSKIKIVIGPEGGITKDEYNILIQKGFKSVSLGKRILRSETAAFNILSVVAYILEK